MYRDCYINDTINKVNQKIKISGWVNTKRDHGGVKFIDLRDHTGILQIVYDDSIDVSKITLESVIYVEGTIRNRESEQINNNLHTGKIELYVENIEILSKSAIVPINVNDDNVSDYNKLLYRTLYLRGNKRHEMLKFRAKLIQFLRNYMIKNDFLEIQTPLITASSPEGARDFVIPSRLHPGKFYALPQAPQIFKQLLMASGINRYFQVAPCFRDEDARKDRCYGEFYQLDVEMSFVNQEDVLHILVSLTKDLIREFNNVNANVSRMTYLESMNKYGSDKPDLRNPLFIEDFSDIFKESEMDLFRKQILNGSVVKGIRVKTDFGKNILNNSICKNILDDLEKEHKFKIAYIFKIDNEIKGPIAKFIPDNLLKNNEAIFFVCDKNEECLKKLNLLRNYLPIILDYFLDPNHFEILEVIDFPMFEEDENSSTGWAFKHNPFSKPKDMNCNLGDVLANQYDLVLNGIEICSGSIRNTDIDLLIKCFNITGTSEEEVRSKFNSMITGFSYGVPPHGGFAIGIDRLIMILLNEENVREVIAFPLNTNGTDPFMKCPNDITARQKKELHLK